MRYLHPDHPERAVRLAYCLNLHAAEDLAQLLDGMRRVTLPLRERLAPGRDFGVGMYLPGRLVELLVSDGGEAGREELRSFLTDHALDPFTFNAFPFSGFQTDGLKQRVFEPTWLEDSRAAFTLGVALMATYLAQPARGRHLSISTHTGMHSSRLRGAEDREGCAANLAALAASLARLEQDSGWRCVLSLEAEPRANCNDTAELARFRERIEEHAAAGLERHLGTCLDACHAAVEFEAVGDALANATARSAPLGKLQVTSAIALPDPAEHAAAREQLFALDEPRFLHQVTGRGPAGLQRAGDLPELERAWTRGVPAWAACEEWRCHFHVPIDLERLGPEGLITTRAYADRLLTAALARPQAWGTDELHVEIETYTWDVLPSDARRSDSNAQRVDALEAEYRHAMATLESAGWRPE
jgi:hypothetical protein